MGIRLDKIVKLTFAGKLCDLRRQDDLKFDPVFKPGLIRLDAIDFSPFSKWVTENISGGFFIFQGEHHVNSIIELE